METKLEEYNIYAGLKGKTGMKYLYTTLNSSQEHANHIAEMEACNMYMNSVSTHSPDPNNHDYPTLGYEDFLTILQQFASDENKIDQDLVEQAETEFEAEMDNWILFKAVLTSQDTISEDDLIRDYITCDYTDETCSCSN